jgi:hypothetical protein
MTVEVDRTRQLKAIACHRSQATDNPVLWRRLDLLGDRERLRYLRPRGEPLAQRLLLPASKDRSLCAQTREILQEVATLSDQVQLEVKAS